MTQKTCEECNAKCCKHVAVEIDVPEKIEDFEDIKWFVSHKNVNVFLDEDKKWYLEFLTSCDFLGEGNKCLNYDNRPQICRDYNHEECVFHNEYKDEFIFTNLEEVERYIREVFNTGKHVIPSDDN